MLLRIVFYIELLPSLHVGLLEIALTVPLIVLFLNQRQREQFNVLQRVSLGTFRHFKNCSVPI